MEPTEASRNIEIKARISDINDFERKIQIAKNLTSTDGVVIRQRDIFFNVTNGRLKLRCLENTKSQLIQYYRSDIPGPKLSEFNVLEIDDPALLLQMLESSIGIKGEVIKTRHLFIFEQVRIHLDNVEKLGIFLEFEVCLKKDESIEYGTVIANKMINIFGIRKEDMIQGAYLDELIK